MKIGVGRGDSFARVLYCVCVLVLALVFAPMVAANDDFAELKPGEGLALLVVDNSIGASSIRIDGPGILSDDLAKNLANGLNVRLMRFPAGEYRWSKANRPNFWGGFSYYTLPQRPEYSFRIEPGVINYPGEFQMQPAYGNYSFFKRTNRASLAMALLDRQYPGVRARFAWRMGVEAPDPFPDFLAQNVPAESLASLIDGANADAKKNLKQEVPGEFSKLFKELFSAESVQMLRLSPSGQLIAYVETVGDQAKLVAFDVVNGNSQVLASFPNGVIAIEWGGDRTLLIDYKQPSGGVAVVRFGNGPLTEKSIEKVLFPNLGLVDALPNDPLRALVVRTDMSGESHVFVLDKAASKFNGDDFERRQRLDKGLDRVLQVFSDQQGRLGAALVVSGKGDEAAQTLVTYRDGAWKTVRRLAEDERLQPFMLSADGTSLIALSDIGRDQVDIVRLDLASGQIGETIMTLPGTDIVAPLLRRRDRAVLGAIAYRGGVPRVTYLNQPEGGRWARIAKSFPDSEASLWDESRDGNLAVLRIYSETNPGSFYLFDSKKNKLEKLVDARPPFEFAKPQASTAFTVRSPDGFEIEAFLTLPAAGNKPFPLVVMPHGGPIGVADRRSFTPDVQLLANRGFAVLRVNYRGSGGMGKAFEQAGHGKWGRQIEQDVEQALDHALSSFPLDRNRVAMFGASYGGYSTLMELIRKPERFRCGVAVSAVTDLPLLFSSSDWNRSKSTVADMKRIVGDPAVAMDEMRQYSPDYQYRKLTRPLLLVHGTADQRVSFEHAWRLRSLLVAAGRAPAWLPLPGGGHSLSRANEQLAVQVVSDNFLHECLDPRKGGEAPAGGTVH